MQSERVCSKCKLILKSGRGSHNRVLCVGCWGELLRRHRAWKRDRYSGDTLAVLAEAYGVSIAAISQKNRYMKFKEQH